MIKTFKRLFFLIILLLGFIAFFYFDLQKYLSFDTLKQHRTSLLIWTNQHYLLAVVTFMLIYIASVAFSIPGASFLTMVAGFLFGIFPGTLYVIVSATIGALCVFLAVRTALESFFKKRTNKWIIGMREGFQRNAMQYLLILRLVPLFPFWVVNIVPALLGVKTRTFIIATFFGIIPGSFIYVSLGSGLGHLLDQDKTPDLGIIFEPQILVPLIVLALLSFLPNIYKRMKRNRHE